MWDRSELKGRAKDMLRRCFWSAVVICLISGIFSGEFSRIGSSASRNNSKRSTYEKSIDTAKDVIRGDFNAKEVVKQVRESLMAFLLPVIIGMGILLLGIGIIISIVVGAPVLVGSKRFFMCNRVETAQFNMILYGFRSGFAANIILIILLEKIKVILWSFLFIIPGIIKRYEYRMIPYILSENPGIERSRAFEISRNMMYGQKWDTFVLDLSFILWDILGAITCGLASVFYVNPYIAATNAELYALLREDALRRGDADSYELPGF